MPPEPPEPDPSLLDLIAGRPSEIGLDRAALELARIEYPDLDPGEWIARLDRCASEVAESAHDLSDGKDFIATMNSYLFGKLGLRGNKDDYYNAANSCLNRVLETGLGIPITLSVIYIEVARRLAMPVRGIGLPGHFIVQYDDGEYSTWIDPFHGGALLDAERCRTLAQVESLEPEMLAPVGVRSIVMRMIANLRHVYFSRGEAGKALRVMDLLIAANPDSAEEHKQRAVALLQLNRMTDSLAAFRRYLELAPHAPDKDAIVDQIRSLAFWIASRN